MCSGADSLTEQLQKMGILQNADASTTPSTQTKAKSKQFDPASLGKLKAKEGTVGFSGYRDTVKKSTKPFGEKPIKSGSHDEMDSDADDEDDSPRRRGSPAIKVDEDEDVKEVVLSAEETTRRAELADSVKKMQVSASYVNIVPVPNLTNPIAQTPAFFRCSGSILSGQCIKQCCQ